MGRAPRLHLPGSIHHVMARGNGGQPIVADEHDLDGFRDVLDRVKTTSDFRLYAYCLMKNHAHLLIRVGETPLSRVMQRIQTMWSKRFNHRHRRSGHVFQGRFKSLHCDSDGYFRWLLRYIHYNPVRGGLVAKPEDWPWSSHRDFLMARGGGLTDVDWPLSLFATRDNSGVESFRNFVLQAFDDADQPAPLSDSRGPRHSTRKHTEGIASRSTFEDLLSHIRVDTGIDGAAIRSGSRAREVCRARRTLIRQAVRTGYRVSEVSEFLGLSASAVSFLLRHAPCDAAQDNNLNNLTSDTVRRG